MDQPNSQPSGFLDAKLADLITAVAVESESATDMAKRAKLRKRIQGRVFIKAGATDVLMYAHGLVASELSVDEGPEGEFVALVEIRRLADGSFVCRASASCGPDEKLWRGRPRFARRAMSLRRAKNKAAEMCGILAPFVLSGSQTSSAEEVQSAIAGRPPVNERPARRSTVLVSDSEPDDKSEYSDTDPCTRDQQRQIKQLLKDLGESKEGAKRLLETFGAEHVSDLKFGVAATLIVDLKKSVTERQAAETL